MIDELINMRIALGFPHKLPAQIKRDVQLMVKQFVKELHEELRFAVSLIRKNTERK